MTTLLLNRTCWRSKMTLRYCSRSRISEHSHDDFGAQPNFWDIRQTTFRAFHAITARFERGYAVVGAGHCGMTDFWTSGASMR